MLLVGSASAGGFGSGEPVTRATDCDFRPPRLPIFATVLRRGSIHCIVACALVAPSAAVAQEQVQVDPNSPAGVEYKLPLEQARRDAQPDASGGGGRGGGGGGGPTPLFGAGIRPVGSEGADGGKGTRDDGNRAGGEQSGDSGDRRVTGAGGRDLASLGADESKPSFSSATAADGESSAGLILGGIALAVVVAGAALGLALRRGLRITPAS